LSNLRADERVWAHQLPGILAHRCLSASEASRTTAVLQSCNDHQVRAPVDPLALADYLIDRGWQQTDTAAGADAAVWTHHTQPHPLVFPWRAEHTLDHLLIRLAVEDLARTETHTVADLIGDITNRRPAPDTATVDQARRRAAIEATRRDWHGQRHAQFVSYVAIAHQNRILAVNTDTVVTLADWYDIALARRELALTSPTPDTDNTIGDTLRVIHGADTTRRSWCHGVLT
jgi:hypothetical protein